MSDTDSEFEGANEYTGLMDGHVGGEVVGDVAGDRGGRRRKPHAVPTNDGSQPQVFTYLLLALSIF